MIYTKLTLKAMKIAFAAHYGQNDDAGFPYIHHPLHVAEHMKTEKKCIVALLHDVIEDSVFSLEDLKRLGIPDDCIEAIDLLTHKEGEDYLSYIRKIKENDLARSVKLADIDHNSDKTRVLDVVTKKDINRWKKYKVAMEILKYEKE